ncbi:hypothetical protein [Kineosporia babensis]|uniref:Histidine phosphatase family protein n=1 Tax=Kineosporia babensis TaxID=499548 RepID=A0A9X1NDP0_9ACTN|nr:hypothetical protein [Kineosporia babensis]MCD5311880.1 hypothetical protein [Kineosporia babensis]
MHQPHSAPPEVIYIIRHAEKPEDSTKPPHGVDYEGIACEHSLLPRGWQRSGALTVLFDPPPSLPPARLERPTDLISPTYGGYHKTAKHRTYQTIQGISARTEVPITSKFAEGLEAELADHVVQHGSGVILICWEHHHIPDIARALPTINPADIPATWPDDRFDVVWTFTLIPNNGSPSYVFGQIPQELLAGDRDTVIAP